MKVRAYVSPGQGASVGVTYGVDVSIPDADLPILIKRATDGAIISRLVVCEKSRCVKRACNCAQPVGQSTIYSSLSVSTIQLTEGDESPPTFLERNELA